MNRRSTALVVAAACLIALFGVAFLAPMPYVVMSPGVTENTLGSFGGRPVISITGHPTYPTTGNLNLTTVSVTNANYHVRLPQVLAAWFSANEIVLPRDVIYPPHQTVQQVEHQNTQEMVDSQSAAVVAGLGEAGINSSVVKVTKVVPGSPAEGVVRVGDEITAVNGQQVQREVQVVAAVQAVSPGSDVTIDLVRSGIKQTVTVKTRPAPSDPRQAQVGVELENAYHPPFNVDIRLGQEIGGPSAGLMFSLGIYDKLTPGPLTGGRFIAGTGTITPNGLVGEIGGIQQKIAGAYDAGAHYFLVPASNCTEALGSSLAGKITLMKVNTLNQAVEDLRALDAGRTSSIAVCTS